jgi:hypothetical protein
MINGKGDFQTHGVCLLISVGTVCSSVLRARKSGNSRFAKSLPKFNNVKNQDSLESTPSKSYAQTITLQHYLHWNTIGNTMTPANPFHIPDTLKPVLNTLQLWGMAVGLVISGIYFQFYRVDNLHSSRGRAVCLQQARFWSHRGLPGRRGHAD